MQWRQAKLNRGFGCIKMVVAGITGDSMLLPMSFQITDQALPIQAAAYVMAAVVTVDNEAGLLAAALLLLHAAVAFAGKGEIRLELSPRTR